MKSLVKMARIRTRSTYRCGFTFPELLAAMIFMAIVIPVAMEGLTIANRAGIVASRKRVAIELADTLLNERIATDEWRNGNEEGDFGEDWEGYSWIIAQDDWEEDDMRLVSAQVLFRVQEREYSVRLTTLVDNTQE